jgi:hypothetical protein
MPSTTNLEEEEIVDALGIDGNASLTEQVNQPNPWRKMMMMVMMIFKECMYLLMKTFIQVFSSIFLNISISYSYSPADFVDNPPLNFTLIHVKSLKLCLISRWVCCMSFQIKKIL